MQYCLALINFIQMNFATCLL